VSFSKSLLILAALIHFSVLAAPQVRLSERPRLIRKEYAAAGERLRATEIVDIAHLRDGRRVVSIGLYSSGEMRFVTLHDIDRRTDRRVETIIDDKGDKAEFRRTPDSPLTDADRQRGAGVLTINGASMEIIPEEARTPAVRRKVQAMLSTWAPADREALEVLYKKMVGCSLDVGLGALLPILFADPGAVGCEPRMLQAPPDPKRDQEFLTILPELADWLKTPATLVTETTK
jgi:hypothetical protein